jgi:hypothetical protein
MRHSVLLPLVALLVTPAALLAQKGRSTLTVSVTDSAGAPVPGAEVLLLEQKLLSKTDASGVAHVPGIPFGEHSVRVRLLGYEPSEVRLKFQGDTTIGVFKLAKSVQPLGSVRVTTQVPVQLKDFESRRKQGIGRFLTEADLASVADRDFQLMATQKFPGLTIQSDQQNQPHLVGVRANCGAEASVQATNRGVDRMGQQPGAKKGMGMRDGYEDGDIHGSCESSRACLVQLWLDNINLGEADPALVRTWDLSGVEYYTGNSVPARYRTSGSVCGVLVLWSKWT